MNALSAAPKWTALERPKAADVQAIRFAGPSFRGKPTQVFAWLGVPPVKAGEKVPAMVLIHGGGGTAFEEWVRLWVSRGYAAIAMDTCGQVPVGNYGRWIRDVDGGPAGWGGLDAIQCPREDQWTYHAVADAILAHSLIRSLPEVDPERTGVTGISWGGYLTCIVAGVDARFKLAVPVYGCGFYRQTVFADELRKLNAQDADRWMEWWDPSAYLGNAQMPMLWVTGSNDFAYTFDALQPSYRMPKGPRTLCIRLRMPHGHGGAGENPEEIRVFADSILRGGAPLAVITGSGRDDAQVWATAEAKVAITKAELNYTLDTGRWQERKWAAIPATRSGNRFTAQLPEGTSTYYFNLFDERQCVVSTEHESLKLTHSFLATGGETRLISGDGQVLWRSPLPTRDGWVLENDHILLAVSKCDPFPNGGVTEVTRDGQTVFQWQGTQAEVNTVQALPNDKYLVTEAGPKPRLLEMDRQGKILIEVPIQCQLTNFHMQTRMSRKLANGNYLVPQLLDKVVREYTPAGKIVWEAATPNWAFTAIRMPNGNTLVGCTYGNQVVEFNPKDEIVWSLTNDDLPGKPLKDACGVQRLPNGNTVITSYGAKASEVRLTEVTADKKIVWTYTDDRPSSIHEFQILDTNGKPMAARPMR